MEGRHSAVELSVHTVLDKTLFYKVFLKNFLNNYENVYLMKSIVVFVAHSDDQVIGVGGTMAKYAKKGYKVYTIVCSFGEESHPHLKRSEISKRRVKESQKANSILGCEKVIFLGLKAGRFLKDYSEKRWKKKIEKIILKISPDRIFTHSPYDLHFDHRAASKIILDVVDKMEFKSEVYFFNIWVLFNFKRNRYPSLVEDISNEFRQKVKALNVFKSQITPLSYVQLNNILYLSTFIKAIWTGLKINKEYGELFYKIR